MPRTLILGCGNPLRSDDAVAFHILDALRDSAETPGVILKSVQQFTPELAQDIAGADTVIFVDAIAAEPPGRVAVTPLDESISPETRFTHSLAPATLLSLARSLYGKVPKQAFLVTVAAASFDLSEKLSDPVARAIPAAASAIRRLL